MTQPGDERKPASSNFSLPNRAGLLLYLRSMIERTCSPCVKPVSVMALSRWIPLLGSLLLLVDHPVTAQENAAVAETPAAAPAASVSPGRAALRVLDAGFVEVFEQVAPSVVVIEAMQKPAKEENEAFDFFFRAPDDSPRPFQMPERDRRSEASGFIIREDGYILTNNHVIDGAEKISVKLKDGRRFPAKAIGIDPRTDIAVVKIEQNGLPALPLGDSDALKVGQLVCAIGVPFALDYSFTIGVVSGKGRANLSNHATYEDYIQTDALINPGNSGGPLFDIEGRVVGMNTLINGIGRGLAFAIPATMLKDVSEQLINTGKVRRPWLGIRIETLENESSLREQIKGVEEGVVINTIEADAPAFKSDLRPADVITAVDGKPVATAAQLQKEVLRRKVGDVLQLTIWRNGKSLTVPVTTGELPASDAKEAASPAPQPSEGESSEEGEENLGFRFENVTQETATRLGLKSATGVVVTHVEPGSVADIGKIQVDDVITEVDFQAVANADEVHAQLRKRDRSKALLLFLERKGQKTYAVLKP